MNTIVPDTAQITYQVGRETTMDAIIITLGAGMLSALTSWTLVRLALRFLVLYNIVDRPGNRSSHSRPLPTGAGIAVTGVILPCWLLFAFIAGSIGEMQVILAATAILAVISFIDDVTKVPLLMRFVTHILAVIIGMAYLPESALLFGGLFPFWADRLITGIAWLWFINLFNFMDGIDGITGVETITIAGGLAAALLLMSTEVDSNWLRASLAAVLAGAAAGFLVFNWHPAQLFLGDAGSIPLGYLLGWLLVWVACVDGLWWLALALPLYYWTDATFTLLLRLVRGEKIWLAHRRHAYQVAAQAGAKHDAIAGFIALVNVAVVLMALLAVVELIPVWWMICFAVGLNLIALWRFHHWPDKQSNFG